MILIKENYTLIKIKRAVLIISVFFNCLIIVVSIFGAYKYFTQSHDNKHVIESFPEEITIEIVHKNETGTVIFSKDFHKQECPYEFINLIVMSLNESLSNLDKADGPYFIRMCSNGKIIKTTKLINEVNNTNYNALNKKQSLNSKTQKPNMRIRKLAISRISQITLPAH